MSLEVDSHNYDPENLSHLTKEVIYFDDISFIGTYICWSNNIITSNFNCRNLLV